ncbi:MULTISPECIES: tyrosine-type recombinase/integrase [Sphingobium]|uniref:Tyrosine-type recombinase/integrase n=1 Tax=Sphingobium tyrosinilyticum TaxID=2715436 RepID=A0ABV9F379_9SPHN
MFRYAIATGRVEHDLSAKLRDALTTPKGKHLAAITNSQQVGPLMRAIEAFDGHAVPRAALRLAPHVFVRPGELRHAEWAKIDFDKALWCIPAEKMKNAPTPSRTVVEAVAGNPCFHSEGHWGREVCISRLPVYEAPDVRERFERSAA